MIIARSIVVVGLAALVAAGTGCATMKRLTASSEDIAVKQEQRTAEVVQAFEMHRDFAQFQAAQARWREGNLIACRESLEQILQRSPRYQAARMLLVEVLLSEENYDDAKAQLEPVLADHPNDAAAHHLMGLMLEAQGQTSEATEHYEKAADLEPLNEQYALSCQNPSRPGERRSAHAQAAPTTISSATPALAAESQANADDEPVEVQQALNDAQQSFKASDVAKARSLLFKAISLEPHSPRLPVRAAVMALRFEQAETAVMILQPAAGRFSDSAVLHRTLATAYYRQGEYISAQRALEHALSLDKSNALAYLLMGCTLEKLGQAAAASSHFEQARRLDPRL